MDLTKRLDDQSSSDILITLAIFYAILLRYGMNNYQIDILLCRNTSYEYLS